MWYSVTKVEHKIANGDTIMAGVVFAVAKAGAGMVSCTQVHGKRKTYTFPAEFCGKTMTKPTRSLDAAIEQSFMCSEAAYC